MESDQLEAALATAHTLLVSLGQHEPAQIVRTYPARAEITGYDNWNGGTNLWDIFFDLPAEEYAQLGQNKNTLEKQISAQLAVVFEEHEQDRYSARIVPARVLKADWRAATPAIPRQVRTNILDGLRIENVAWYGQLNDVEFLSRLFDLNSLPSTDPRYRTAADDIWQHCINNEDWDRDWVFTDQRFRLLDGPHEVFLRFLCETIHPVVRPDRDEALRLVSHYNDQLRQASWEVHEEDRIGGRPRFSFRELVHQGGRAISRAKAVADALDAGSMAMAIQRLELAIDTDPSLAIGTAKELVESTCKTVLTKRGVSFTRKADLGDLTKLLTKDLQLVSKDITDEVRGAENIRHILRDLTSLTHHLAELRGLYGTGHGRDGGHRGLQPRHARLAVSSAVAFIDFISATYQERENKK